MYRSTSGYFGPYIYIYTHMCTYVSIYIYIHMYIHICMGSVGPRFARSRAKMLLEPGRYPWEPFCSALPGRPSGRRYRVAVKELKLSYHSNQDTLSDVFWRLFQSMPKRVAFHYVFACCLSVHRGGFEAASWSRDADEAHRSGFPHVAPPFWWLLEGHLA